MTTILVAPAQGRRVVTPAGQLVPEKFKVNPADPYWARALRDKDIVPADQTDPAAKPVAQALASAPVTAETPAEKK
ncbi:hypothetical protein AD945_01775 [Gluconobacter albidus]|uniref:DUF2635 domain-containing protein n=1 Tax=Gluconobacter albidus TaxID=318683 RepID=A0A149TN27_9PROT|nr:DUF2635 domain-containing protein [Gluconobacter albidus]KXV50537.1 hypothetical protein AD945_01775 [Gluconobacter albidus]